MSGVCQKEQQLRGVWCHSLKEPDLCELLHQYHALLLGLHGPKSGTLLLQHTGGLDSFINSSSDLTKKVQPFHPCLKFINAVIEAQVSAYGSHGLYCGLLSTALLRELLLLTQDVPQSVIREVADGLASKIINHCAEPASLLDLSNLHQMLSFLSCCLDSKALGLNAAEKSHLRAIILEAFLMSVSDAGDVRAFGDITVTIAPGRPPVEAATFKGILYRHHRFHELSMSRIIKKLESSHSSCQLKSQSTKLNPVNEFLFSTKGPNEPLLNKSLTSKCTSPSKMISRYSHNFSELHDTSIRLVLFNTVLQFTNTKTECVKFTGNLSSSSVFDSEGSKKLVRFIKQEGIQILACQKVVSESITLELERHGVLVLERLGTSLTASMEKLSSCRPLSDLSLLDTQIQPCSGSGHAHCSCPLMGVIGSVDSIQRLHLPSGLYLLIQNTVPQLPVVTLLLPALSTHVAENLKVVVEQALRSVSQTALMPGVVCSRCWGASLAAVVHRQDVRTALLQHTTATEAQVSLVQAAFWRALHQEGAGCSPSLPPLPVWAGGGHAPPLSGVGARGSTPLLRPQGAGPTSPPSETPASTSASGASAAPASGASAAPASGASAAPASGASAAPASGASAASASGAPAGCLQESHAAAYSAISSALETVLQLLQVDYCIFDK